MENSKALQEKSTASTRSKTKKETLKEIKSRMLRMKKLEESKNSKQQEAVIDEYALVASSFSVIRGDTGILFDDEMASHRNEYDPRHQENPNRYLAVITRCNELQLIDRCRKIECSKPTIDNITKKHSKDMYDRLNTICQTNDMANFEKEASKYDSVYFNKDTLNAALTSAGCVLSLVKAIVMDEVQNGMAIVRPPGHHAMYDEYCGYCFFNNVAIAAQEILDSYPDKKILIFDIDVHHGQATQQMFYEDNRVLYFSIHRYEHGLFWPNLRESNFDFVGANKGLGFNINVPLNKTQLEDKDYLAIVLHLLLPVAYEFQPDLIIVSAGFDACIGCPEGEMKLSPGFYGHVIKLLSGLANGKIAVCLEGGYFLPSLAEGAAMTLKSLLDDPTAILHNIKEPEPEVQDVINNLKFILKPYWKCFKFYPQYIKNSPDDHEVHDVVIKYCGEVLEAPFPTRNCYPERSNAEDNFFLDIVNNYKAEYRNLNKLPVAYVFDEEMLKHVADFEHPENPKRLKLLHEKFLEIKLDSRCKNVPSKYASKDILELSHGKLYVEDLIKSIYRSKPEHADIYFNEYTSKCVLKSSGCFLALIDYIMQGNALSGAAFIRPPGHHAEYDLAQGFCFVNNVAIGAKHLTNTYHVKRILIIDFDIHHGNGTQHAFYDSQNVLYISVHRYDRAVFYPGSPDANYDKIGTENAKGYNVNIPFSSGKMGNVEYISTFHRIVLPIAYEFNPEVVIISAGFDAGINDPLGHYKLSPEAYGHFIQMLKPLAGGKLILALEGGYNATTVAYSMISCIKTLLGDPLPQLNFADKIIAHCQAMIEVVIKTQRNFWSSLKVDKLLPKNVSLLKFNRKGQTFTLKKPNLSLLNKKFEDCGEETMELLSNMTINNEN